MRLSTGKIGFPIEFDNGDRQTIFFNPSDPDLVTRLGNFRSRTQGKIEGFKDLELMPNGEPVNGWSEEFEKLQDIIKEELDVAFGGDISRIVFKHCSPFAIVDGEYFIVQFLNAITPEIKKHIEKAQEESRQKMSKHLDKYRK